MPKRKNVTPNHRCDFFVHSSSCNNTCSVNNLQTENDHTVHSSAMQSTVNLLTLTIASKEDVDHKVRKVHSLNFHTGSSSASCM